MLSSIQLHPDGHCAMGDAVPQEQPSSGAAWTNWDRGLRDWRSEQGGLTSALPALSTPESSATTTSCMAGAKLGAASRVKFKSLGAVYRVRCQRSGDAHWHAYGVLAQLLFLAARCAAKPQATPARLLKRAGERGHSSRGSFGS